MLTVGSTATAGVRFDEFQVSGGVNEAYPGTGSMNGRHTALVT